MRQMVEEQKTNMNLSAVRLCFQAYLPDETGCFTKALPPCISDAVYDSSKMILNVAYSYIRASDISRKKKQNFAGF